MMPQLKSICWFSESPSFEGVNKARRQEAATNSRPKAKKEYLKNFIKLFIVIVRETDWNRDYI